MAAKTIYLLPGLLCDASVWAHQRNSLAAIAEIRVADFYGFNSLTAMARSILEGAPERFALAGHSMGARVALEIMRLAPERVDRLALLDTGSHPPRVGEAEKRQVLVDLARREGMAGLAAQWLPPMVHPDRRNDGDLMEPLTAMVCRATPDIFESQIRALLNRRDASGQFAAITCPTLVGCGRQDEWSPLEQHEAIAAEIPRATLVVFEDSGHMAPVERPDAVSKALHQWLQAPR